MSYCNHCHIDKPDGEWRPYRGCSRIKATGEYFTCSACLKKAGIRTKKADEGKPPFKTISIPFHTVKFEPIYKCEVIDLDTKELLVVGFEKDMEHVKIGSTVEVVRPLGTPPREYRVMNIDRRDEDKPMKLYVVKK